MSTGRRLSLHVLFLALVLDLVACSGFEPEPTPEPKVDPCLLAFLGCDFTFPGIISSVPVFSLGIGQDVAFTTQVISKTPTEFLGVLNTNNIVPEFILPTGVAVPITSFGAPHFTPTHFKPFSIPHRKGSGVGHQTFQGNQATVARGQCLRIYFTEYQVCASPHGPVIGNFNHVPRVLNKCVVFRII